MIKDIFDIEPIQKNSVFIFIGFICLSFLQLYVFKNDIIEKSFVTICLSISMGVVWFISSIPSAFLFHHLLDNSQDEKSTIDISRIILLIGLLSILSTLLLTYILYEINASFKIFIRISLAFVLLKPIIYISIDLLFNKKTKK
jgi:hypothetical protein